MTTTAVKLKPAAQRKLDAWRDKPEVTHVDVISPDRAIVFYETFNHGLGVREVYLG